MQAFQVREAFQNHESNSSNLLLTVCLVLVESVQICCQVPFVTLKQSPHLVNPWVADKYSLDILAIGIDQLTWGWP
jgi:hypothetical protein